MWPRAPENMIVLGILVRTDLAGPLFDAKNFRRNLDFHVLLHGDLTGEAHAVAGVPL